MRRIFTLALPLLFFHVLHGQSFEPAVLNERLDSLTEQERVSFIIDNFYAIYSADFDQALKWTKEAIELASKHQLAEKEGYARLCYGTALYLRGDYPNAIASYQSSEKIFDSLSSLEGIARVNNEMAVFYSKNEEYENAFASLDKSEQASLELGNQETLGTSYSNRGAILGKLGRHDEAFPYFKEVLKIRIEQKDSVGLGYIYLDFSEHAVRNGNIDEAIDWVSKSTSIRRALKDQQGVAVNTVIMGEIYFGVEEFSKAIPYFKNTIQLATPIGYTDLIRFAYGMLQQSFENLGDYEKAYLNQSNHMAFKDSLLNVEKTRAIAALETKYETEKKEQQIALQKAQISEERARNQVSLFIIVGLSIILILLFLLTLLIKSRSKKKELLIKQQAELQLKETQIEASIASQEAERARFAKDLHDGFGQMISILNLNLKSLDEPKADRHQVFENSSEVLDGMYRELKEICFDLMPETLIKTGLPSALKEFAARINKTGQLHVQTDFFGMEDRLEDIEEVSLYRITQEWVNNIVKYGKASQVMLQITRENDEITLLIEDDGPGFDQSLLTKNTKGNGWKNIQSRVNLIKGTIELDTLQERKGNTLIIDFSAKTNQVGTSARTEANTIK